MSASIQASRLGEGGTLELTDCKDVAQLLDVVCADGSEPVGRGFPNRRPHFSVWLLQGQKSNLNAVYHLPTDRDSRIAVAPSRAFERMNDFPNKHEIHPVIDKAYAFEQAREAYEHLGGGACGKIVIIVAAGTKSLALDDAAVRPVSLFGVRNLKGRGERSE